ncbi:MAG TPA: hypothetical protein VFZ21_19345 [Gemmatimonadaceae bacterium]|nr:hypothetical protein [Gemmatimonadaceae bacterium]
MSIRFPALALVSALILAACSDDSPPTAPARIPPAATLAINPAVACTGATVPVIECQALVALYNNTNGPAWTDAEGWGTTNPCRWQGVQCTEDDHGFVSDLDLQGKGLSGPLPPELGNLDHVGRIILHGNPLTGAIPPELGGLASVRAIRLSFSQLTAPLPVELTNIPTLEILEIWGGTYEGTIPSEFGNFPALRWLTLELGLTGTIPATLGNISTLTNLVLQNNDLTGPIPASFGNLSNLIELRLGSNALTGSIPAELGNLTKLEELMLSNNNLTGPIPATLGNLTSLVNLSASWNELSGPIPASLGNASSLRGLFLWRNALTGSIPPELGNIPTLKYVWLNDNQLTGTVPASLGALALETLRLDQNQLSGELPLSVAQLGETIADQSCAFAPGNVELFMPDDAAYRAADTNGDGLICELPIGTSADIGDNAAENLDELVPDPLTGGQANALKAKFQNAIDKADNGQYGAAINQMQSFLAQLGDMVAAGTLTPAQAEPFIEQAEWLIAVWAALV